MSPKPLIAGVGMIPFAKPGKSEPWDVMGAQAARLAMADTDIPYQDIGQAFCGYVYADSTAGQSALYEVGLSGLPIINVNNNCATGSTALFLACQAVQSGAVDVALALGFEQMSPGALGFVFADRNSTMGRFMARVSDLPQAEPAPPPVALFFGGAGAEHQERFGTKAETFARFAVKARAHAANNPHALFRDPLTLEQVLGSPPLYGPLTRYQACAPTCGAAAAIVVSPAYARRKGLGGLIEVAGQRILFQSFHLPVLLGKRLTK